MLILLAALLPYIFLYVSYKQFVVIFYILLTGLFDSKNITIIAKRNFTLKSEIRLHNLLFELAH